ncbi:nuclear factor 7, brain-like [Cyprinodon tularosa]|uniref:nuclear factor 7, brain-like n=1 Tax=Cyprinodon tularosa TaxID=77115 RepID=UPI0018E23828|nr:nuclear factor 7, brain-like [Cyprinodon tularosa]
MAESTAVLKHFLSCYVCSETFRDPVSLSCNHSFCSSCLKEFWEQAGNKNCPICKRRSSKEFIDVNFSLKEVTDSFAGRQKSGSSKKGEEQLMVVGSKQQEHPKLFCEDNQSEKGESTSREKQAKIGSCSKHQDVPHLFCKDDQRAVCPVCEFSLHQNHKVVPLEQAVSDLKEQLKSDLKPLQEKKDKCKQVKKTYDDMFQHSKEQLFSTERQIRAEFTKLHQFLKEEEESRLAALREEEEQKRKTISIEKKRIQEQISSLSDSISAVEEDLQKNNMLFLSSYKATQSRVRAQSSLSDPQLLSGALIDVAKHLGNLSFRVWEKMKEKVQFYPVILDPNTAYPGLHLSVDLTTMRRGETKQQLPDNPERNTNTGTVFGSEGFSSGRHSWEVEVGDHPDWTLGVVKESAERKGARCASPKHGIWSLWHGLGIYTDTLGTVISVKKSLHRIKVQLDYDRGEVSFYNPEDMTHIYTHRDTFTEKLFPYFGIRRSGSAKTSDVKIFYRNIAL